MSIFKRINFSLKDKNSFTLVEMIIVIAILTILTAAAVFVINPVEWFNQSRDTQRMTDLKSIQTVIERYKYTGNRISSLGNPNTVYVSLVDAGSSSCADLGLPALASGWSYNCVTATSTLQDVDGTGWIPVNLSGVGLIPSLPIDPTNASASNLYYSYIVNSTGQFELTATLESQKKLKDTALVDGGTDPAKYETGETVALWTQASGLIGWWPFDEGGGSTTADLSGNNNTGSLCSSGSCPGSTPPTWVSGKVGKYALTFNNSTNYVNVGSSSSFNIPSKTIAFWANPAGVQTYNMAFANGGGNYYVTFVSGGAMFASFVDSGGIQRYGTLASGVVNTGVWAYYAYVFNVSGSNVSINAYINGNAVGTLSWTTGYYSSYAAPYYIGTFLPASYAFNGALDDVRVYNRALSATEIQNMYNATK